MPKIFEMQKIFEKLIPKHRVVRSLVAALVAVLLVFPSLLTALVSTEVNLVVGVLVISMSLILAKKLPKLTHIFIFFSSAVLAFPPFPLWLKSDGAGGVRLEWTQEIINRAPIFHVMFFIWNLLLVIFLFKLLRFSRSTNPKN
jgi:hypothetical protein